jgi:hypothetical protein
MSQPQEMNQSTRPGSYQEAANVDSLMAEAVQNIEANDEGRELSDDELEAIAGGQRSRGNGPLAITK